jgi:hypothetical protein
LTVAEPFQFASEERSKYKNPSTATNKSPILTAMEKSQRFLHRLRSDRKSKPNQTKSLPHDPTNWHPTVPEEFNFETTQRAQYRPTPSVLSAAEREELELKSMPTFKATPLDRSVIDGTRTFKMKPVERTLTQPEPFHFATDMRLGAPEHEPEPVFNHTKSQRVHPGTGSSHSSLRSDSRSATLELTIPQSPALSTKQRAALRVPKPVVEPSHEFKARPMPIYEPYTVKSASFEVRSKGDS